jgi:hypothetical protein
LARVAAIACAGRPLPACVEEEFDAYLKCGRLEQGFLRLRCEQCRAEKLVAFSCRKRGFCQARRRRHAAASPNTPVANSARLAA